MYVTRPLSVYKNNPSAVSLPPPEGPNSGYLVLQDDASTARYFFGLFKDSEIKDFPFPQNKLHSVVHTTQQNNSTQRTHYPVYFIPAINRPLSSNIYYAIKTKGNHKGEACANSTDEDMTTCCLCICVNDVDPKPLDPTNTYQQFKMSRYERWHSSGFNASSVAYDGHPPSFLRRKKWGLDSKTPKTFSLGEAQGMETRLRARLPDFNFSVSSNPVAVVVGKWYCPFMFIKDQHLTPKEQVKKCMYYEMSLEQQWNRVFYCDNENAGSKNTVFVDIRVPTESVTVAETDAIQVNEESGASKVVWFDSLDGRTRAGVSSLIVERMMWEEERVGWVPKEEKQDKVLKIDEFGGQGKWARYGCYMLVERFVLRRMDGTVVLTYSFNHTHQIRSKWD